MRQALDSFIIEGVTTTIPFLGRVMRHPDFVAGTSRHQVPRARAATPPRSGMKLDVVLHAARSHAREISPAGGSSSSTCCAPRRRSCAALRQRRPRGGAGGVLGRGRQDDGQPRARRVRAGGRAALYCAIPGFPLGNSPREMTPDQVGGKTVYLATTNGTPALVAAQGADPVLVGAAVNFAALAERARDAAARARRSGDRLRRAREAVRPRGRLRRGSPRQGGEEGRAQASIAERRRGRRRSP